MPRSRCWFVFVVMLSLLGACRTAPPSKSGEATEPTVDRRLPEEPHGPPEMRGCWVVAHALATPESVAKVVADARRSRFNSLFVQVRSRGDAWYLGGIEPRAARLQGTSFDPLAALIEEAADDIEVHVWINCCLVADARNLPTDPRHVVNARPEWLSIPKELAGAAATSTPIAMKAALVDYATARLETLEGLFCDPAIPEYRAHLRQVVEDICRRYPVAGIHMDYIRYPNERFGHSKAVLEAFRRGVDADLEPIERRDMAKRVTADPLVYTKRFATRFARFRQSAVTTLAGDLAAAARGVRPTLQVSAAVLPEIDGARERAAQDWTAWLASGLLDAACPMIYSTDRATFQSLLDAAVARRGQGRIWAGIGAWRLAPAEIAVRIEAVRASGSGGSLLFSYQGLGDIAGSFDALAAGPWRLRARPVGWSTAGGINSR